MKLMEHVDKEKMMAYIDEELSSEEAELVRKHLEECAQCREEHADSAEFTNSVTQTGRFVFRIKPMTQDESERYNTNIKHRLQAPKWRIASVLCLLFAIVILLNSQAVFAVILAVLFLIASGGSLYLSFKAPCKQNETKQECCCRK